MKKRIIVNTCVAIIMAAVAGSFYSMRVSALGNSIFNHNNLIGATNSRRIGEFSENEILFYDPGNCTSTYSAWNGEEITWEDLDKIADGDTRTSITLLAETYGELAMALQEEYGVPWELVFIQMGNESGGGVNRDRSVAIHIRDKNGKYNLLGMDVPKDRENNRWMSDTSYPYTDGSNKSSHEAAEYDSLSLMIIGYVIGYYRNGLYGNALEYWGYENFDFWTGFQSGSCTYVGTEIACSGHHPYSDPNGAGGWFYDVVAAVAKEKNWPSSEELAKSKKIGVGGNWPEVHEDLRKRIWDAYGIAGLPNSSSAVSKKNSDGTTTGGSLADKAKELAWEIGDSHGGSYVGNDAYNAAARKLGNNFVNGCELSPETNMCYSCARFVSLSIYESGLDKDFISETKAMGNNPHMIGTTPDHLTYYLANSKNWERVEEYDGVGYEKLQAGDVLIWDKDFVWDNLKNKITAPYDYHTFIYLGDGKVAEGSNGDLAPYAHEWGDGNNGYVAFRLKNSGSGAGYCNNDMSYGDFDKTIVKYTWPQWDATRKDSKQEYKELIDSGKYYNGGGATDCNGYVTKMIIESGIDPNYNQEHGTTQTVLSNIQKNGWGANWETISSPGQAFDSSTLKKGDVFLKDGHTFLFVGELDGFDCDIASASLGDHVPVACNGGKGLNASTYSGSEYYIFRKK